MIKVNNPDTFQSHVSSLFQFVLLFSYFQHVELQFYLTSFHDNISPSPPPAPWNSSIAVIFLDVKDQTEYFMEKGEIRKYIPFFLNCTVQ